MSPKIPSVSGAETVKALQRAGFTQVSQRGSHVKLRHENGRTAIVPMHGELARGTLSSILRQAGLTAEQFIELLSASARGLPLRWSGSRTGRLAPQPINLLMCALGSNGARAATVLTGPSTA